MSNPTLHRLAAFTRDPAGGNPAGVWVGDDLPDPASMQRVAAEVGFSETAFVVPARGRRRTVRYFSPEAEVSFCGHATIAAGVVLGSTDGTGTFLLSTAVGDVPVAVTSDGDVMRAALTSVPPAQQPAAPGLVAEVLDAIGWAPSDLDEAIPPARAYAGAWHLVLAAGEEERLRRLDYDFPRLKAAILADGLTTVQCVWREAEAVFHSRNPFPVGGVVEDPATGAAAAALGGYLRDAGLLRAPMTVTVLQGVTMGRPSRLTVDIPLAGGIVVSGTAVPMAEAT